MEKIIKKMMLLEKQHFWYLYLLLVLAILVSAFHFNNIVLFIASGVLLSIFYGWNNYRIFHYPHTDEFYKEFLTKEKHRFDKKPPPVNAVAKINERWVHLVSGVTGSVALYFLSSRVNLYCSVKAIENTNLADGVLFLVALLGYSGLLPRTLWFLANKGGLSEFSKPS